MSRIKQLVGLDLGARHARAAWVQLRGGQPRVTRLEQMSLPVEGGDRDALLRSWLERLGLTKSFAAVALPGSQVVFQPGRIPQNDPRTPRQAADMELATFNDMAGDHMLADVCDLEWSPQLQVYLLAMARPSVVTRALEGVESLGIRAADLIPAPIALFNALREQIGKDTQPVMFLNIGHTQTELAIGTQKGVLFARSIPSGGKGFSDAIAQAEGVSPTQADTLKMREGSLREGTPHASLLTPLAERWFAQINACFSAYRGPYNGPPFAVGRILLSGGGARLDGLVEFLRDRSGLEVTLAEPPTGLSGEVVAGGASCDLAVGLALTALEVGTVHLSLLPPKLRDEVVFREKKPYWIAASIMGALTLGVFTVGMIVSLRAETQALEVERRELRKREQLDKGIAEIRKRNETLRAQVEPLRKFLRGGPTMREVVSLVANSIDGGDWISLICDETAYLPLEEDQKSVRPTPPRAGFFVPGFRTAVREVARPSKPLSTSPAPPKTSDFDVFIVEGFTADSSLASVKLMMERLRTSMRVRKVDLLSDDRVLPPVLPQELADVVARLPDVRRFVMRLEVTPL